MIEINKLDHRELEKVIRYAVPTGMSLDDFGVSIAAVIGPDYAADGELWNAAKREFRKLICEQSPEYEGVRKQASKIAPDYTASLISVISAAMGAVLGIGAAVIAPIVALLLLTLAKVGRNSICASWPK